MKKVLQILVFTFVVLVNTQITSAADKVWADEEFNLASLHRLYISDMNYSQLDDSPQVADIFTMFYQQGSESRFFLLQKADLERFLLRDTKVDISVMTPKAAKIAVKEYLHEYADAYVVPTIIHNNRVVIFYDVYTADTGKWVFSYQTIAGSGDADTIATYAKLTKNFYHEFEKAIKDQIKDKK